MAASIGLLEISCYIAITSLVYMDCNGLDRLIGKPRDANR